MQRSVDSRIRSQRFMVSRRDDGKSNVKPKGGPDERPLARRLYNIAASEFSVSEGRPLKQMRV